MNEYTTVELHLDNDEVIECLVLTMLESAEQQYIALMPLDDIDEDGNANEDSQIFIYRYSEDESGEPSLDPIETDEDYEIASDLLDEWFDTMEYEMLDD